MLVPPHQKVSREDALPKKICDGCSYKLDMLYVFWNTSAESEQQLLSWVNGAIATSAILEGAHNKNLDAVVKQETLDSLDIRTGDGSNNGEISLEQSAIEFDDDFPLSKLQVILKPYHILNFI